MSKPKFKTLKCECGQEVRVDDHAVGVICSDCIVAKNSLTPEQEIEYLKRVEEARDKPKRKVKGVGNFARNLIRENPEINGEKAVEIVKQNYPDSKFNLAHFKYYLCKIKKELREAV